jgi:hypothetical protein
VFPETPVDQLKYATAADSLGINRNSNNNNNVKQSDNDCERNVAFRRFNGNEDKVTLNWTTGDDVKLPSGSNFVNFR